MRARALILGLGLGLAACGPMVPEADDWSCDVSCRYDSTDLELIGVPVRAGCLAEAEDEAVGLGLQSIPDGPHLVRARPCEAECHRDRR